ncbi:hypothetical protein HDU67_003370 [Dinochytrium kinnereticum]|nr:hypothetical protein HDU67_003370 [Dinochytrium kinnereticum]
MSYFLCDRPDSAARLKRNGKRFDNGRPNHKESEQIWADQSSPLPPNHFSTTNKADFTVPKLDPRAKAQRPIRAGTWGAGEDHITFLQFQDADLIFRRCMSLPQRDVLEARDNSPAFRRQPVLSTHHQDFTGDGFEVKKSPWDGSVPAGRPSPKVDANIIDSKLKQSTTKIKQRESPPEVVSESLAAILAKYRAR